MTLHDYPRLLRDLYAITGRQVVSIDGYLAEYDLHEYIAAIERKVLEFSTFLDNAREQVHVLVYGDRAIATVSRCDESQLIQFVLARKGFLFISGLKVMLLWKQPDLQQMQFITI